MSHAGLSCDDARAAHASPFKARTTTPEHYRARLLLGGVAAALALLVSLILTSVAYATTFETRQAESLGDPDGAGKAVDLFTDADATPSGATNNALQYENVATVTYDFGVKAPTGYTRTVKQVDVRARNSSQSRGPVTLALVVDGVMQDTKTLSRSETSYKMLSWVVSLPDGTDHQIGVRGGSLNGKDQLDIDYMVLTGTDTPVTLPADTDGDGVADSSDNCPSVSNASQTDTDADGAGDACDSQDNRDSDSDGLQNYQDQCLTEAGPASNNGCPAPPPPPPPPPANKPDCTSLGFPTLASQVSGASGGGTLNVQGSNCVYREPRISLSKDLDITGGDGVELRGSDVWTGFSASSSGGNWVSANVVPALSQGTTPCNSGVPDCSRPELVFVDGVYQEQVATGADPGPGQFALDSSRHVVLGSDPSGKQVEVGTRPMVFRFLSTSSGSQWIDFDVSQVPSQSGYSGAFMADGASNIVVKDSHFSYAHGSLVSLNAGSNMLLSGNEIDHGGQLCVHSHMGVLNITNNVIHDCNTEDYDDGWEAGGVKSTEQNGAVWSGNTVYDINGTALWADVNMQNTQIFGNRIHDVDKTGIYYEISHTGQIYKNVLYNVGHEERKSAIRVGNSSNTTVQNNVVAWSYKGIGFERSNRSDEADDVPNVNTNQNVTFSGNWVIQGEVPNSQGGCERPFGASICDYYDGAAYNTSNNITFLGNAYWYPTPDDAWVKFRANNTDHSTEASWNNTAYASAERYMSETEKVNLISTHKLPALLEN